MPYMPTGEFDEKIRTANGRVDLARCEIIRELQRLRDHQNEHPDFPYRLLGQREMLSQNSWLHNVETTMKKGRGQTAKVHPEDANRHGLGDGDIARIESPWGEIEVQVKMTDDMKLGNIALPHGWGHNGGWRRANQGGGVNANLLTSDRAQDHERCQLLHCLTAYRFDFRLQEALSPDFCYRDSISSNASMSLIASHERLNIERKSALPRASTFTEAVALTTTKTG